MTSERVARAAVKVRGRVFTGSSHKVAVFAASLTFDISPVTVWAEIRPEDQGFVTSRGRFVSRAKAWVIAEREGQLRWKHIRPGVTPELHSEDLR
jgi:hypothetical protein